MDHPLVEWLATLPPTYKLHHGEGKYILKKAMEPHLPQEILYRPKMGFAVPLGRWFHGPLRSRVRESILGARLADTALFDHNRLKRVVSEHESGLRDNSAVLWALLMFDAFLRNVLDRGESVAARRAA
jgi:asparagine synthase (glutamine-hydrolysing)